MLSMLTTPRMRMALTAFALPALVGGCTREAIRVTDSFPPVSYIPPSLITGARNYEPGMEGLRLEIFRTTDLADGRLRLYVNVVDSLGHHVAGLGQQGRIGKWCMLLDSSSSGVHELPFTVHEGSRNDTTPLALALGLALDHSGSMGDDRTRRLQEAANDLLRRKAPQDAVAIVKFDVSSEIERELTIDTSGLPVVGSQGYGGRTAMFDACSATVAYLAPFGEWGYRGRGVILLTDGEDNSSSVSSEDVLAEARRVGVPVFTIRYGSSFGRATELELEELSGASGGKSYHIYHRDQFTPVFDDILARLQNHYVVELEAPEEGWHALTLKQCIGGDSLAVTTRVHRRPDLPALAATPLPPTIDVHVPRMPRFDLASNMPIRTPELSIETVGPAVVDGRSGRLFRIVMDELELTLDSTGVFFPLSEFVRDDMLDAQLDSGLAAAWTRMLTRLGGILRRAEGRRHALLIQGHADISAFCGRDSLPFRTVRGMPVERYMSRYPKARDLMSDTYEYLVADDGRFEPSRTPFGLTGSAFNNRELAFLRGVFVRDRIAASGLLEGVPILLVDGSIEQVRDPRRRTIALYLFESDSVSEEMVNR